MADNTRAAIYKPVKRSLLSHSLRAGHTAGEKQKYRVDGQSVNYAALYQYERDAKAFDNPKVREALNYAINLSGAGESCLCGLCNASYWCGTADIAYAQSYKWPLIQ